MQHDFPADQLSHRISCSPGRTLSCHATTYSPIAARTSNIQIVHSGFSPESRLATDGRLPSERGRSALVSKRCLGLSIPASISDRATGVYSINSGAALIVFAGGLLAWSHRGWRLLIGVSLLFVFGIGVIVAGFFQIDPNNLEATTSQYHDAASLITFPLDVPGVMIRVGTVQRD